MSEQPEPQAGDVWEFHTEVTSPRAGIVWRPGDRHTFRYEPVARDWTWLHTNATLIVRGGKPWPQTDSQPTPPMIAEAGPRTPEGPAVHRIPSGALHDFSDPYCVRVEYQDCQKRIHRRCTACGAWGPSWDRPCMPRDWRSEAEEDAEALTKLADGHPGAKPAPLPAGLRIDTPSGRDAMVGGFWRRAGDGRTRRVP